ncbi:very long chain fatty acid elongase 6-like [Centruroides vittatus]|uniref:very long chain fatty acid elongase 6-like n=1 Tax=Centruroides vittatus TaxID=120091 RepID=UPI00350FD8BC
MYNLSSIPEAYEFEYSINKYSTMKWLDENWHISIYVSAIYIIAIFSLRSYMENRPAYDLQRPLILWNMLLATFSICGTCRMLPGFLHILKVFGFTFSLCDNVYGLKLQGSLFWGWLFICSKVIELGDTFFIILRKRKLIFLHWFHHMLTLIMVWHCATYKVAISHWTGMMNYTVHSFMYTYYTLRAMGIKVPKLIAMCITCMQLMQMLTGVALVMWIMAVKYSGYECYFPSSVFKFGISVYLLYAILFGKYFYSAYLNSNAKYSKKIL